MLQGVNLQIVDRLDRQGALAPCSRSEIEEALGSLDPKIRCSASIAVIRKLWRSIPGLGVAPALARPYPKSY